jgi:glucose-6-phosphate isomerase
MKSLKENSGLDIKIDGHKLVYGDDFQVEPKTRPFSDAKKVYLGEINLEDELYYMYRYFEKGLDKKTFEQSDCEYDITVLNAGKVGDEFIKTKGHYHSLVPNTDISYPEVYEVIEGNIEYLIQKRPNDDKETEVVIIEAQKGDKIIVPPNYGHVSMNLGKEPAVESNLQKRDLPAVADYGGFEYYKGGAMYRTEVGWKENKEYVVKSVKYVTPKEKPEWGLEKNKPLYSSFIESQDKFKWVTKPQDYDFSDIWTEIK